MLSVQNLTKRFGGLVAVDRLSLEIEKGSILGIIGPNGAGKTTLLNLINGFLKRDEGAIYFRNKRIDGLKPHQIVRMGIGRTFQIAIIFRKMTALENMLVPRTWWPERIQDSKEKAVQLLKFFELYEVRNERAGNLSGGQQKLLDLAIVSMLDPDLYLLDEPFFGVHPVLKNRAIDAIATLRKERGKTFALVSHDMPSVMALCDEVVVMSAGATIARCAPEHVRDNMEVVRAYLGE